MDAPVSVKLKQDTGELISPVNDLSSEATQKLISMNSVMMATSTSMMGAVLGEWLKKAGSDPIAQCHPPES